MLHAERMASFSLLTKNEDSLMDTSSGSDDSATAKEAAKPVEVEAAKPVEMEAAKPVEMEAEAALLATPEGKRSAVPVFPTPKRICRESDRDLVRCHEKYYFNASFLACTYKMIVYFRLCLRWP